MSKKEDLGVKFGNDEMIFWRNIIDARKLDIESSENNIKYFKAIIEIAEKRFKEAEKEFNKELVGKPNKQKSI